MFFMTVRCISSLRPLVALKSRNHFHFFMIIHIANSYENYDYSSVFELSFNMSQGFF